MESKRLDGGVKHEALVRFLGVVQAIMDQTVQASLVHEKASRVISVFMVVHVVMLFVGFVLIEKIASACG